MMASVLRCLPLLFVLGCGDGRTGSVQNATPGAATPMDDGGVAAESTSIENQDPSPVQWTAGIVEQSHVVTGVALLTDIRTARNEGFDRVVIEFHDPEMPSYRIEYVDQPVRQCGSGEVVPIEGDAWLLIRLEPANAHDEQGRPTVAERSFRPGLPTLREVSILCDFEAQVEWVIGVASPNLFRVMELGDPARLVIDVRH